jgi:ribosomal protein S18 acetylase RimI-like enzyme
MKTKKDNVIIRTVSESDITAMTSHRIAYLTEMQGEKPLEYLQQLKGELAAYFREHIQDGSFFALVAESEGQILGYGAIVLKSIPGDLNRPSYLEGDILNMYTLPHARKQGIGRMILEALVAEARPRGLSKIGLHTSKDGEHLYRSFGFHEPVYPYLELVL